MKKFRFLLFFATFGFFIFTSFFTRIINLLVDLLWFDKVGYLEVFYTILSTKAMLGIGVFAFTLIFFAGNVFFAARGNAPWFSKIPIEDQFITVSGRTVRIISLIFGFVLSLLFGFAAVFNWSTVLQFIHQVPFGQVDPIFGNDIGFYVFTVPFLKLIHELFLPIVITTLVAVSIIYAIRRQISLQKKFLSNLTITDKTHLVVLLLPLFALIGFGIYLQKLYFLFSPRGIVYGVSFTDLYARIPLVQIQIIAIVLIGASIIYFLFSHKLTPIVITVSIFTITVIAGVVYPEVLQKIIVAPNELAKEAPFIAHNIKATRKAFNLDTIEANEISGDAKLTASDIDNNNITIKNIRLWDRQPLLDTFSQIQEIRTYYDFVSIDDDRYIIDGELRQIMLSPRELSPHSLPNRNFINEHLIFTHGYGLTFGPINQVTPEGLPVLFIKDIPPVSQVPEVKVVRPEIYFGQQTTNYVFTDTNQEEFDYPTGQENKYTSYEGLGGIPVNSIWKKLLFTLKFKSFKILLSDDITDKSKILINRNISRRVAEITQFLSFDHDPYMVVLNGRLYWILDTYTQSKFYPYAQPGLLNGKYVSYARNAVKAVIDAYNGDVSLYIVDSKDPIIQTLSKAFPNTFKPIDEMPEGLRSHIRYPSDIFMLQAEKYQTYHMVNPTVYYNQEDRWDIPRIRPEGEPDSQFDQTGEFGAITNLRHLVMKLPGQTKEEFILINPYTPKNKDNLIAWLAARSDGENYGKLVVYQFPKQKLIFGPKQIIARINQDADISRQITLWDQRGSQVIQGPLLVIPIEGSLLYVRPLYIHAEQGRIPELKRVIVAYENKIAMEQTLNEALSKIFGTQNAKITPRSVETTKDAQIDTQTINNAQNHYNAALRAQREGDWGRYGEEIQKLGKILDSLVKQ